MHPAIKRRAEERQKAIELAQAYVERVRERLDPLIGVLFGSHARGDFNLGSDIDVLILSHALPEAPLARLELLYEYVEGRIEPQGYTEEEFLHHLQRRNPMAVDAIEHGVVLAGDERWTALCHQFRISNEVERGEVGEIIGRNGGGNR